MQTNGTHAAATRVIRSLLFVPGDSERKLAKSVESDADALIVDLEDSVTAGKREGARALTAAFLADNPQRRCWVRMNPLWSADAHADLCAVIPAGPMGVVLPKPATVRDCHYLGMKIGLLESQHGIPQGSVRILPIVTETPGAVLNIGGYANPVSRLAALTWGAEDLSAVLGGAELRSPDGTFLAPYSAARTACLMAASTASLPAIETVYTDFRDSKGLERFAAAANRDGFEGMLAIHPDQIGILNEAFQPDEADISRAQAIVALFANNPDAGALGLDGEMLDRPHLHKAKRVLARAGLE